MSRLTRRLVALAAVTLLVAPGTASARSPDARSDTGVTAMGSDDQIFEDLPLIYLKETWIDRHRLERTLAVERQLHETATRLAGDCRLFEPRLNVLHARLHLLDLLHHLAEVLHWASSLSEL